jgi:tripartite-type tricarboxylate transporter receptor subunit TctC
MIRRDLIAMLAGFAAIWPLGAQAQNYPTRPITMVVPYAAGGTFDVMGRLLSAKMTELLGQSVIVENTTGAGGIIGVNRVINAAPDGYIFLLGSVGTHAYNQTIYKKPRYHAATDFAPVTLFAEQPMVLESRKSFPANSLQEFVAYVKANQAKLQFGSAGAGSTTHLACSLINTTMGVTVTHVPYRGAGPAHNDLIGGQIDYMCSNIGGATPLIKGNQVKAIATLSRERSPLLPELATAHEQGMTGMDITTWNAMFLPKGTPAAIIKRLGDATNAAMDDPTIKQRMRDIGVSGVAPERRTPEYLAKYVVDEIARWEGPIKQGGLQVD